MVLFWFLDWETTGRFAYFDEPVQVGCTCERDMHLANSVSLSSFSSDKSSSSSAKSDPKSDPQTDQESDAKNQSKTMEFGSNIYTKRRMRQEAVNVTGITNDMLAEAPLFAAVYQDMEAWLQKLRRKDEPVVLAGHRIKQFDIPILCLAWSRHGIAESKDWVSMFQRLGVTRVFDTCEWAQQNLKAISNHRLSDVVEFMTGQQLQAAHSALGDVHGVRMIMQKYFQHWHRKPIIDDIGTDMCTVVNQFIVRLNAWKAKRSAADAKHVSLPVATLTHTPAQTTTQAQQPSTKQPTEVIKAAKRARSPNKDVKESEPKKHRVDGFVTLKSTELHCPTCQVRYSSYFGHVCLLLF